MSAPRRAMVLAAGLGQRMGALALDRPKPLLEVAGRALIDHALDALAAAGIEEAVVNLHYKSEMIAAHLARRTAPRLVFSHEAIRLETGGGVARALDQLGPDPFLVVNSDILWRWGSSFERLVQGWDDAAMDARLLLNPERTRTGDFVLEREGRLERAQGRPGHRFTGIQLLHPRLFEGCSAEPFSLNRLYDRARARGRLFGLLHDGLWLHTGTPEELSAAERILAEGP